MLIARRFRLGRLLGAGGMGAVYEAHDEWTGRRVALKRLNKRELDERDDPQSDERFFREARVIASLDHPHIVRLHDLGRDDDGSLYLVQELLDGVDLRRWLRAHSTVTDKQCVELVYAASDAIVHAHEMGVIHRDLKPENIFVERAPSGRLVAKVIDFGIARHTSRDQRITPTGQVFGTPSYMAPEQADGHSSVDPSWDCWALAIIAFESLTGRNPYARDNVLATLSALLKDPAPSITELRPDTHPALAATIDRALLRDRSARFEDCAAFRDALLATGLLGDDDAWARALVDRPRRSNEPIDRRSHERIARDATSETAPIAATAEHERARTEATIDVPDTAATRDLTAERVEPTRDAPERDEDAIAAIGLAKPRQGPLVLALVIAALGAGTLAARSLASTPSAPLPATPPTLRAQPLREPSAVARAAAPAAPSASHGAEARPPRTSAPQAISTTTARRAAPITRTPIQTTLSATAPAVVRVDAPTVAAQSPRPLTHNVDDETSTPIRRYP